MNPIKQVLLPFARLVRLPALFSAWADVWIGAWLARGDYPPQEVQASFLLTVATSGLYLSGMAFNDLADLQEDREFRPQRPIPSGAISPRTAVWIAASLMLLGNAAAWMLGASTGIVALILSANILAYDFGPRGTFLAALLMGLCRGLNLLLGMSTGTLPLSWIPSSALTPILLAYVVYIFGVTWLARRETVGDRPPSLFGGLACLNVAMLVWCGVILLIGITSNSEKIAFYVAGVIALFVSLGLTDAVWSLALRNPNPENIQRGVRRSLTAIIPQHAALLFAFSHDPVLSMKVLALMIPARLLSPWMKIT